MVVLHGFYLEGKNIHAGIEAGWDASKYLGGGFFKVSAGGGLTWISDTTDYSEYTESNETFSSQNMHTGAICRRYVGKNMDDVIPTKQRVTLFVYRMTADGGTEGTSITVNVDLAKAVEGVSYE